MELIRPVAFGIVTAVGAAMRVDYMAFKTWKSFQEARSYDWSIAKWRWFQGAVVGLVTALGALGVEKILGLLLRPVLVLVLVASLSTACTAGRGLVSPNPSQPQVDAVRTLVVQAAEGLRIGRVGLTGAREVTRTLPDSVVPAGGKDVVACLSVQLAGVENPSQPDIVAACGTVPTHDASPINRALTELESVNDCPGLRTVASRFASAFDPQIRKLETSTNLTLRGLAISIRGAFAALNSVLAGGSPCSV